MNLELNGVGANNNNNNNNASTPYAEIARDNSSRGMLPGSTDSGSKANLRASTNLGALTSSFADNVAYVDFEVIKELGHGAFGKVVLAKWNNTNVAVKVMNELGQADLTDFFKEAEIMKSLPPHENVVLYLGMTRDPPALIMQYCPNGSLYNALHSEKKFETSRLSEIAIGIAQGMKHLASHHIVHRDLATRNVLLGQMMVPRISDFVSVMCDV